MKMKKSDQAVAYAVFAAWAYVVLLAFFACAGKMPADKELVILTGFTSTVKVTLPFTISLWWSLLLLPGFILYLAKLKNKELLIGKKPNEFGSMNHKRTARDYDYDVRDLVWAVNSITLGIFYFVVFFCFLANLFGHNQGVSSLASEFVNVFIICGIIYLFCVLISGALAFSFSSDEPTALDSYKKYLKACRKTGTKALPLALAISFFFILILPFKLYEEGELKEAE